jgi:hypothetical protein
VPLRFFPEDYNSLVTGFIFLPNIIIVSKYTGIMVFASRFRSTCSNVIRTVKGALPPTIAVAMYQSSNVAIVYGNFGFLIAVASILALHLQTRGRFQENILMALVC